MIQNFLCIVLLMQLFVTSNSVYKREEVSYVKVIDTVKVMDTIRVEQKFNSIAYDTPSLTTKDIKWLVGYIKTQTGYGVDRDFYLMAQTMVNRLIYKNCSMQEYCYSNKLSHSGTLEKIFVKPEQYPKLVKKFEFDENNPKDILMYMGVIDVISDNMPDTIEKLPLNTLYFQSHGPDYVSSTFQKDQIICIDRHVYYNKPVKKFYLKWKKKQRVGLSMPTHLMKRDGLETQFSKLLVQRQS